MKRRYLPKKRLGITFLLSSSLLAVGALLYAMVAPLPRTLTVSLLTVMAYALVFAAFGVLVRFGVVGYEYYFVDGLFYVVRLVGRRRRVVCDLSLAHIRATERVADGAAPHTALKPRRCFNYTVSPLNRTTMRIYYGTDEAHIHLLILSDHPDFFGDLEGVLHTIA